MEYGVINRVESPILRGR